MAFPHELTEYNQWAVSLGDAAFDPLCAKIPINHLKKQWAAVNDPETFLSFADITSRPAQYPWAGFIFSDSDPYTVIDLDKPTTQEQADRHTRILQAFSDTYAEISVSGTGVHIICRGSIPCVIKADNVEVYSRSRYIVMTGNTLVDKPIIDCQAMLDVLYAEMPRAVADQALIEEDENWMSDATVVDRALSAANGDKFSALSRGDWSGYPSQSEADLALISILCFWTRSNEQVRRIFRITGLGRRDKATKNDVYLNRCLQYVRSHEPPMVDFSKLPPLQSTTNLQHVSCPQDPLPADISPVVKATHAHFPPGVLGEIATYITQSSIRPVPEVGLVAALAFASGVVGRQYNISGTGLNQYLILMAPTGTGKEGAASGLDRLFSSVAKEDIPAVDIFQGPGAFASGQALIKRMADKPCFVSVLGEFGLTIKRLSSKYISPADITLKQALLDLYQKSGWQSVLKSSVYSDKEKNSAAVQAPSLTILGESTPESLVEELTPQLIADGLLPRFIIVEYTGHRPKRNRDPFHAPSLQLMSKLKNIIMTVLAMQSNSTCCNVLISSDALKTLDDFDEMCDKHISSMSEVYKHLWNRAHLKALKLAGLAAVADNPQAPVVTAAQAAWAIKLVEDDVRTISKRFEENSVGDGEVRLESLLRRSIEQYAELPVEKRIKSYAVPKVVAEDMAVIPYHYLRRRFRLLNAFTQHRNGVKAAIKLCIDDCLEAGIIQELGLDQTLQRFGVKSKVYIQGPAW